MDKNSATNSLKVKIRADASDYNFQPVEIFNIKHKQHK